MSNDYLKNIVLKNSRISEEAVSWFFSLLNTGLLLIHLVLEALYINFECRFLSKINLFSIFIYVMLYFFLKRKKYRIFVIVIYLEVLVHSSLATVILGWPAGFQLWLLALSCAYFFPTLVFEEYINPEKLSWLLTGLSAATFFVLLFHSRFGSDALMSDIILSGEVYFCFHLFNCVVTYFVVMFFSAMFVKGMISTANKLSEYANFDNTTGLYNRNGLGEILKTRSFEGDEYSISIMDIDDFKSINDTYGHKAGDAALKYVGTLLNELINEDRALCRWGGDEFLFVQTGKNSFEQLYDTLEKLRIEIENSNIVVGDTIFHITISAGVAKGDKNFDMYEALECADRVLYQSKANGKNCIKKLEG